jgi:hypothetical protein
VVELHMKISCWAADDHDAPATMMRDSAGMTAATDRARAAD